jgi:hypothetical protein
LIWRNYNAETKAGARYLTLDRGASGRAVKNPQLFVGLYLTVAALLSIAGIFNERFPMVIRAAATLTIS